MKVEAAARRWMACDSVVGQRTWGLCMPWVLMACAFVCGCAMLTHLHSGALRKRDPWRTWLVGIFKHSLIKLLASKPKLETLQLQKLGGSIRLSL